MLRISQEGILEIAEKLVLLSAALLKSFCLVTAYALHS
jgi:hypothetical protein